MPPPPLPVVAGAGTEAPATEAPATPFTRGAEVGVARGPFGPVLALRGAGLGALCPDMATVLSCADCEGKPRMVYSLVATVMSSKRVERFTLINRMR